MTMPTCPTCNASPGRALRSTAVRCQGIRPRMDACGCRSTSPHACSRRPGWAWVIVAPTDVAPVEIAHPVLFLSKPGVRAFAAARRAEADEAARKADQARLAVGTALREASQAMVPVRVPENLKRRAEAQLAAAETALGAAIPGEAKEQAERTKAQAVASVAELDAQLAA